MYSEFQRTDSKVSYDAVELVFPRPDCRLASRLPGCLFCASAAIAAAASLARPSRPALLPNGTLEDSLPTDIVYENKYCNTLIIQRINRSQ